MSTFSDLPDELIVQIRRDLGKEDVKNLYGTCRRLRKVVMVLRCRELTAHRKNIRDLASFAVENIYFSLSINTLNILEDDIEEDTAVSPTSSSPAVQRIVNEIEDENKGLLNSMTGILAGDDVLCQSIILLSTVYRLENLSIKTKFKKSTLKWVTLELIATGRYCQTLKRFSYDDIFCDSYFISITPADAFSNLTYSQFRPSTNQLPNPGQRAKTASQSTGYHLSRLGAKSASIENISICMENLDPKYLEYALSIPTSLKNLNLCQRNSSSPPNFSKIGEALRQQAGSLREITIDLPLYKSQRSKTFGDQIRLGSLVTFEVLTNLQIPVDILLGPNANDCPIWSHLLPPSIQAIYLDRGHLWTHSRDPIWSNHQLLRALQVGIAGLRGRCTNLQRMTIACLQADDFQEFKRAIVEEAKGLELEMDGDEDEYFTPPSSDSSSPEENTAP